MVYIFIFCPLVDTKRLHHHPCLDMEIAWNLYDFLSKNLLKNVYYHFSGVVAFSVSGKFKRVKTRTLYDVVYLGLLTR